MALAFKPHTITIGGVTQTVGSNGVLDNPSLSISATVACQIERIKPSEAFQEIGVELKAPIKVLFDVGDASRFAPNAVAIWGALSYYQVGEAIIHQIGDPTDHGRAWFDRLQYDAS